MSMWNYVNTKNRKNMTALATYVKVTKIPESIAMKNYK